MSEVVYVNYRVQRGDTLSKLLKKTYMTRNEWMQVNGRRSPDKSLFGGEWVVIKDPIVTCQNRDDYRLTQQTTIEFSGGHYLDVCEDAVMFDSFKPLRAFTKPLQKDGK